MSLNRTSIEWAKNPDGTQGYTWNPITGCLNGCPYCYARRLANGRLRHLYLSNGHYMPIGNYRGKPRWFDPNITPFYPRFWEERKLDPMRQRKTPKGIFVCDMSDLFGIGIPEEWIRQVFATINCCPQHRFYLLTKQPQNLIKFSPFPENCWVGVTATTYKQWCDAVLYLLNVEATVRFISFEPLLESMRFTENDKLRTAHYPFFSAGIQWVIIGSQTKPYKPPKIEWVQEIAQDADKAGVAVFLKDNLERLLREAQFTGNHNLFWRDGYYTDITHPEVDLRLRQEIPNA